MKLGIRILLIGVVVLLNFARCEKAAESPVVMTQQSGVDYESTYALADALDSFQDSFIASVEGAASKITQAASTRPQRLAAARWRLDMVSQCKKAIDDLNPRKALVNTWALCVQMKMFLESEQGKTIFGDFQGIARDTADHLHNRIRDIAGRFLSPESMTALTTSVQNYAEKNPIGGKTVNQFYASLGTSVTDSVILNILKAPLAPLQTFGKINRGSDSLRDMVKVSERFSDIIEDFPASTRWQLQLLLSTLRDTESVDSVLTSLETLAESSRRFSQATENLPAELREQATTLIRQLDESQDGLQKTLSKAQVTLEAADLTLARVERISESAEKWTAAVKQVEQLLDEINSMMNRPRSENDNDRSFDVSEYTEAAAEIGKGAESIRNMLADFENVAGSQTLDDRIRDLEKETQNTMDTAALRLEKLTNKTLLNLAAIVFLVFVLALIYRKLTIRWQAQTILRNTD